MTKAKRQVLTALVIAGIVAALGISVARMLTERANRAVALAVDYTDLQRIADLTGRPITELLAAVRDRGATHIALTEWSAEELAAQPAYPHLSWPPLIRQMQAKLPETSRAITPVNPQPALRRAVANMKDLGLGYDPDAVYSIRDAGLRIIARPRPDYTIAPKAIAASLDAVEEIGARIVIFQGTQVLGNSGLIGETARGLQERGLIWGMVELIPQEGEHTLAAKLNSRLLRVHSIGEAELAQQMNPARAAERYSLAVRERKVRVCYLHLFFDQGEPLSTNLEYIGQVAERLRSDGFSLDEPELYTAPPVNPFLRIALYLAIGAVVLWLLQHFFGLSLAWFWSLFLLLVLDAVLEGWLGKKLSADLAALFAALIFPAWGLIALRWPDKAVARPVGRAIVAFLGISLLTVAGGLLLAATLTDLPHLMGLAQFRGVKLAQLLPLALVGLVMLGRAMPRYREARLELGERRGEAWALREGLAEALGYAVRYWHVVVALIAAAAVGVMLLRSGNESFLGASGLEREVRAFLDHLLWVRPRTKEFLFGQPLLVFSLILLYAGRRRGVWLGLTAGAIGQVSLLNTFCHLHTPLLVSLVRSFHGLWIGLLLGLVLWLVVSRVERAVQGASDSPGGRGGVSL